MRPLDFINVPLILTSPLFLIVAWLVGTRTPQRHVGKRFVAFCGVYGAYSLSIGLLSLFLDKRIAFWVAYCASATGVFTIPVMYDFLLTVAEVDARKLRIGRVVSYSIAVAFAAIFAVQIQMIGVTKHWWGYYPTRSQFLPAFLVYITILISHAEWIVWRRSCESPSVNEKNQLRMLFWSTLITIPSASSNIAFCLYDVGHYPFSSLGGLCYAIVLAYAVVRYRLLDIDIALRKGLLYTLLTATLTAIFVGTVLYVQGLITRHSDWSVILPSVISTMLVALALQPFRGKIQAFIDRRFFRSSYAHQQAVAEFTESIVSEINLDAVLSNMVQLIEKTFHVSKIGIFLVDEGKQEYPFANGSRFSNSVEVPSIAADNATIRWMVRNHEPILRADVKWHPLMAEESVQQQILEALNALDVTLLLPILYESNLRGVVALGDKFSEQSYTIEDLRLLGTVASEAAVAIENARLVEALREEDRRKAQLITDMAHELKTPVTSIKLFAQILGDGVEDAEKRNQFLKILVDESDRYVSLVNDFLYFTRMESGDMPLRKEPVALDQLAEEVLAVFQVQAQERNIQLDLDVVPPENGNERLQPVPADRDRLKQVLMNLVNNAIKYSGQDGHVTLEVLRNGQFAITRVRDSGIGIPPEELPRVFDKHYRTRHARAMVGAGGTGIGLTIAKDIVDKHCGALTVESEPGKGSTFTVKLPVV